MKGPKKNNRSSPLQDRLMKLEKDIASKGIQLHYDRLEAAGLRLKGGLCRTKGEYHIYVDKRKSTAEKIDILLDYLTTLPEDNPPEKEESTNSS